MAKPSTTETSSMLMSHSLDAVLGVEGPAVGLVVGADVTVFR